MNINQKIAEIPLVILYGIIACFVTISFVCTYLYQKDYSVFREDQPIDYFLASLFSNLLGTEYREYFLFAIPIMLFILYGAIRLGGWLVKALDKNTEINGENHTAIVLILMMLPNFLHLFIQVTFGIRIIEGWGGRYSLMTGFALMIIYITLTEITDRKAKKRQIEVKN